MINWKKIIQEATAAEIRKAGAKVLRDERNKNKTEKITKGKSAYQTYLDDQQAFKEKKYEDQKAAQLEKIRQGKVQKPLDQAKQSIANIKTTPISDQDREGTAYYKLIGNVGSTVGGVSGAVFNTVRALAAKKKNEKEVEKAKANQPEMKPKGTPGRPKKNPPAEKRSSRSVITGLLRKSNSPPRKQYIGNTANIKEKYSNWREELLIEVDTKKKKIPGLRIIDVMKGKNTIKLNPEDKKVNEESAAWQRKAGKNPEGGLNAKGIASYRAQNPGSKLSMAVTTPPSKLKPGSKSAKRRKSFCARMGGMPGPMKDEKGRPTRKALALRKWNC